jgi:2-polyprenyl-3-methyl-5-hydroxy-6-metoxy-1,4-benzoquinol methylase
MSGNFLPEVRNQYEKLPYPERNPEDEHKRLLGTNLDNLRKINHYCFKGSAKFSKDFRVLVAGGGTGDALIYLAEQLKNQNVEITYLDLSSASMDIAQARAKIRGLDNIVWRQGSLLDLNAEQHGEFDYINCSGVLHHLESPIEGLRSLKAVLAPKGAMGIMVYAKYGRTAIYQMQELLRIVNGPQRDVEGQIQNAKSVLDVLPVTNWLKRSKDLHSDHERYGDIGIYDLFLHSQDRAYSIPELAEWLSICDLEFIEFAENKDKYNPLNWVTDAGLASELAQKPDFDRYAIAELITGDIIKHAFYCGRSADTTIKLTDRAVPDFATPMGAEEVLAQFNMDSLGGFYRFAGRQGVVVEIPVTIATVTLIRSINGKNEIRKIKKKIEKKVKANARAQKEVSDEVNQILRSLIDVEKVFLSRK